VRVTAGFASLPPSSGVGAGPRPAPTTCRGRLAGVALAAVVLALTLPAGDAGSVPGGLAGIAHRVSRLASAIAGQAYAGVYVDERAGRVHVELASPYGAARLASAIGDSGLVEVERVPRSRRDLIALRDRIVADRGVLAAKGAWVLSVGPDYRTNRVGVEVAAATPSAATLLRDRYGASAVEVRRGASARTAGDSGGEGRRTEAAPSGAAPAAPSAAAPSAAAPNTAAPAVSAPLLAGGMPISQDVTSNLRALCSAGYIAEQPTLGRSYLLTAGHCLETKNPVSELDASGRTLAVVGLPVADTDPPPGGTSAADAGLVQISTAQARPSPTLASAQGPFTVVDADDPVQGETLCKTGGRTGTTCGQVVATDLAVTLRTGQNGPSITVQNLAMFRDPQGRPLCDQGDSGGAVFRPGQGQEAVAVGIVTASSASDPSDPALCDFTPIRAAFAALGAQGFALSLLVAPAAGASPQAPATPGPTPAATPPAAVMPPAAATPVAPSPITTPSPALPGAPTPG
jgi:hypothetical protein